MNKSFLRLSIALLIGLVLVVIFALFFNTSSISSLQNCPLVSYPDKNAASCDYEVISDYLLIGYLLVFLLSSSVFYYFSKRFLK